MDQTNKVRPLVHLINCKDEINLMKIDKMHAMGLTGNGVTIAVIDTGFYKDHSVFSQLKVVGEWDFINGDNNTQNQEGEIAEQQEHGTFVLGLLAAYSPKSLIGVAYEASYLLAKTERPDVEIKEVTKVT